MRWCVLCGMLCDVMWCDVMWCGVVWWGVVWWGVLLCGVVWCGVVWCGVVRRACGARCIMVYDPSCLHSFTVNTIAEPNGRELQ